MPMTRVALAAALLLGGTAGLASAASAQMVSAPQPLAATVPSDLPRNARPLHYTIAIEPDAAKLSFTGQSSAEIEMFGATPELVLHAVDLAISEASLVPAGGGAAIPLKIVIDPD